mmetsp:Transcript_565/g.1652  ORF Transcript_565/g.1652 Transcript_565/m.1652 type:complete len:215 (-) Transcript_565:3509-4153(-)
MHIDGLTASGERVRIAVRRTLPFQREQSEQKPQERAPLVLTELVLGQLRVEVAHKERVHRRPLGLLCRVQLRRHPGHAAGTASASTGRTRTRVGNTAVAGGEGRAGRGGTLPVCVAGLLGIVLAVLELAEGAAVFPGEGCLAGEQGASQDVDQVVEGPVHFQLVGGASATALSRLAQLVVGLARASSAAAAAARAGTRRGAQAWAGRAVTCRSG